MAKGLYNSNIGKFSNSFDTKNLSDMSDSQINHLIEKSINMTENDLPDEISDRNDIIQKFVFNSNMNEKSKMLSNEEFEKYLKNNNLSNEDILTRSVESSRIGNMKTRQIEEYTAKQILDKTFTDKYQYIGGKYGGSTYGKGTYFGYNNGKNTGYGDLSVNAVLKKNAKVIRYNDVQKEFDKLGKKIKLPNEFQANPQEIITLIMGYDGIRSGDVLNVINRSALIVNKNYF